MPVYSWSTTAGSNATADATINWAEGMAPSAVNDSARAMMAALAKWSGDISGAITTAGTSTAYTLTSNSVFDTLSHMNGQMIAFVPHTTSGGSAGSQITLNVDGLGAKPMRFSPNVDLPSGTLVQGTPYVATYNNSDGAFYLQGLGSNPYLIPLGAMLPYTGSTAPNSAFVLPFGQAISRTTYVTYFSLVGTTYGSGDGSTTFNIIDMRGRLPYGQDNMGGSAAGRMTSTGGGIDGTTLGASGGNQTVTLARANLPNVDFMADGVGKVPTASATGVVGNTTVIVANSNQVTTPAGNASITVTMGGHIYLNGNVSQTPVQPLPPGIIVPYILRVI